MKSTLVRPNSATESIAGGEMTAPRRRPKRVLHIVPALFGSSDGAIVGGAERYALELARHMADVVPTTLVTFGDRDRHESEGRLEVRVIGDPWYVRGQRVNPVAAALIGELRRADIVQCHQQHVLVSSLTALACRLSGRRVFVIDHGGGGWDISAYMSTDHWYHGHLHVSEYSRKIAGHTSSPRAHVIWGGVDTDKFSPGQERPRERALYVGRMLSHKGIDNLIGGLPCGLDLDVVGTPCDSRYFADLQALARGKPVRFHSGCDDAALVEFYRSALCIVLPSVYRTLYGETTAVPELLGQTLLEGMACGAPAICTAVASMPEIVEDGVSGFVVPPNDPETLGARLQWLRDHPSRAREMGKAARDRVLEKFTWPRVVDQCLRIYEKHTSRHPEAPLQE